jgi:uncharacterized protein with PQ loop repeat
MNEVFAFIGTSLLFLCPLPQTIMCIKNGHANGLSGYGLFMWMFGCLCMFVYLISLPQPSMYVIVNYGVGVCFSVIQLFYKLFPRS